MKLSEALPFFFKLLILALRYFMWLTQI